MNSLENKTWEDIVLMAYQSCKKQENRIKEIIEELEYKSDEFYGMEDFERYVNTMKKKICIPKWTVFTNATPDDLEINADHYNIYCGEGFFYEAKWEHKTFWIFDVYEDDKWCIENGVKYWMPIVYPGPY